MVERNKYKFLQYLPLLIGQGKTIRETFEVSDYAVRQAQKTL